MKPIPTIGGAGEPGRGPRVSRPFRGAAVALAAIWIAAASAAGAAGRAAGGAKENPHAAMKCEECHSRIPEKGTGARGGPIDFLKKDPVGLCRECHPVEEASHHPVVKRAGQALPEGLPLGAGGEVICSTCHDVHLKGAPVALLRGFDTGRYSVRMDMCLDCHAGGFSGINPHQAEAESKKCYTCHVGSPAENATVSLREDLIQTCDFCHNVSSKQHPLNVDPLRKLPESLPRSRKGEVMCGTCHDPHGSDVTLHFLRMRYVEFLEAGRYANPHGRNDYASCLGCHNAMATKDDLMRQNLRYGGEDLQICLSCHGGMDACHPILVPLLPGMKAAKDLGLSADGKIKCTTCHDPTPKGASGVAIRGNEPGQPSNALCFRCHNKIDLAGRSPHATMSNRETCKFCHDTMTDPTNEEAARVSFISNTRLICLRCHAQTGHPSGVNHMVLPKSPLPEEFKLDVKGKITCTTCHNPHLEAGAGEGAKQHRFVIKADGVELCSVCHRR